MAHGLWSSGVEDVVARVTISCGTKSMGLLAHFWGDKEGDGAGTGAISLKTQPLDIHFFPVRPCFSNVPEFSKTAPPTGVNS